MYLIEMVPGAGTNLPETNEQVFTSLADYANECAYTIDKDNNIYTVELRVKRTR